MTEGLPSWPDGFGRIVLNKIITLLKNLKIFLMTRALHIIKGEDNFFSLIFCYFAWSNQNSKISFLYLSVGLKKTAFDVGVIGIGLGIGIGICIGLGLGIGICICLGIGIGINIGIGIGLSIDFFESFNYILHVINKNCIDMQIMLCTEALIIQVS